MTFPIVPTHNGPPGIAGEIFTGHVAPDLYSFKEGNNNLFSLYQIAPRPFFYHCWFSCLVPFPRRGLYYYLDILHGFPFILIIEIRPNKLLRAPEYLIGEPVHRRHTIPAAH